MAFRSTVCCTYGSSVIFMCGILQLGTATPTKQAYAEPQLHIMIIPSPSGYLVVLIISLITLMQICWIQLDLVTSPMPFTTYMGR